MPSPEGVLERAVAVAPPLPGCYIMRGAAGEVLYVGKAKDLKARLRAYLGTDSRPMVPFLVAKVRDVEVVITATEKEALILENSLIKEHRPRYNVDFRDDKAYFHIRVDVQSPFPRLSLFRRPKEDGARYFGPYPSSAAARETVDFLQGVFRLRNCLDRDVRKRTRPCLEFEIGRCAAPCCGFISADDYRRSVEDAISFLEGGGKALMKSIEARMHEAAQEERFEEAALLRD
ncbi:MAG: GIY-YIG nuclease family protein, partial [Syntrophales bacterium]|nr:GIY-YIG nuclease family protein [Syntrophales bacterium]